MAWSGDYMAIMDEIMKERWMDDIYAEAAFRIPIYHRIDRLSNKKNWSGKYAKFVLQTQYNYNGVPRDELDDVVLPGIDQFENMVVYLKQYMSSIGWTQEEAEDAVLAGGSAAVDLVNRKVKLAPRDLRRKLNYALMGDGTGRLARVASYSETSAGKYGTVTVDNLAPDFGWHGLTWMYDGMLVDIMAVSAHATTHPTGTTFAPHAVKCRVSNVTRDVTSTTSTFRIDVVSADSASAIGINSGSDRRPANGDIVFLSNSVGGDVAPTVAHGSTGATVTWAKWNNTPGLLAIVDSDYCKNSEFHRGGETNASNGSWYGSTFQGLDRGSYPQLRGGVWRADSWASGTAGTATTCDIQEVQKHIRMIDEEGEGNGRVTSLWMNGATRDWLARTAWAEQNALQESNSGKITPGIYTQAFRSSTGTLVDVVTIPELQDGHIWFICEDDLIYFDKIPIGWHERDGRRVFSSPGTRNLTHESWLRTRMTLAAGACWNCGRMEDIDITA